MIDAELASQAVRLALDRGASDAECTLSEGEEFSAGVRMRSLETLKDAGSRGAGLRVFLGKNVGSSSTSDLSREGVRKLVDSALEIAAISTEDPHAGLPDPSELGSLRGDLQLYSDDVSRIDTSQRIDQALQAEDAALSADPRITNSEGASFDAYSGGARRRVHGARLLVFPRAKLRQAREPGHHWPQSRPANPSPSGFAQSADPESPGGLRPAHRPLAHQQYLRGRRRRLGLS